MFVIGNVIKLISSVTPRGYESQAYRVDIEENDCKIIALHIVALYDDSAEFTIFHERTRAHARDSRALTDKACARYRTRNEFETKTTEKWRDAAVINCAPEKWEAK